MSRVFADTVWKNKNIFEDNKNIPRTKLAFTRIGTEPGADTLDQILRTTETRTISGCSPIDHKKSEEMRLHYVVTRRIFRTILEKPLSTIE